jgi:chemotaxis protein methyltransferase CheR
MASADDDFDLDWPGQQVRSLTDREFALFQAFIRKETGIYLSSAKKALLVGRLLKRVRQRGCDSFGAYYRDVVRKGDLDEQRHLLECICTHETHFFRDARQFEYLENTVLPSWRKTQPPCTIRAWSAGCSTGEEPYTLAMVLLANLPRAAGWGVDILATDISTRALGKAAAALFSMDKAGEIPPRYLKTYMLRGKDGQAGLMKAGPELRAVVRFEVFNLNEDHRPAGGPFDLIFCRNVMIYFDPETRRAAVRRMLWDLAAGGYLFLGHAETLNGISDRVQSVGPTVYGWTEKGESEAVAAGRREQ